MIRWIDIRGLRGIRQGRLNDLTPLVVLVGPNGSGKSTVLEGLLIGASPVIANAVGRAVQRHRGVSQGARWLLWKGGEEGSARIIVAANGNEDRIWDLSLDRSSREDRSSIKCVIDDRTHVVTVNFAPGNTYSVSPIGLPHAPLNKIDDVRLIEVHTGDFQPPLHQLFTRAVEQGRREQAKEIISDLIPGFVNLEILTEGDAPILEVVYKNRSVPVVLAGDGVQSLLRLSLELAARPQGVVLVEEPELHQHPGAIRQSARAILAAVRRDIQVILTTHSLELIDSLLSETTIDGHTDLDKLSVYGVALKDGKLISARYSGDDVAQARGDIQEDLR